VTANFSFLLHLGFARSFFTISILEIESVGNMQKDKEARSSSTFGLSHISVKSDLVLFQQVHF
jgi:hypothetical protein